MGPNTTWTVRLTVKVTAPSGAVITQNGTATEDTFDPNLANNISVVSTTVGPAQSADLSLRIQPAATTVARGDLITYAFPVWNLGPDDAVNEVLTTQVPEGTTFDYIRISGTPGLGTCTAPPYQGTGQIVCHQNGSMAPNTTWTVRLTVKVTAPSGTVITENAATMATTPDPNLANNTATVRTTVQ
jgi:large repetitive protein